jgi:hypothetical protein
MPDDPIDDQIASFRAKSAQEEAERAQRREEKRVARLRSNRDALIEGRWKPKCVCDDCLRSIFSLNAPDGLCREGLRSAGKWW